MGIDYQMARTLIEAQQRGASFATCLTIGRQEVHLHPQERRLLAELLANGARPAATDYFRTDAGRHDAFADRFLKDVLGVESLDVLDFSNYQGATITWDLNSPVGSEVEERFDAVIDGGTLEHIFHVPAALANIMRMARVGGAVFLGVPANNMCGHGFYQFSPELMFRVFSPENGFQIERLRLFEARYPSPELTSNLVAYDVVDPADVRERVGLMSTKAAMMIVEARRTARVAPFETMPQQSDYATMWEQSMSAAAGAARPFHRRVLRHVYRRLPGWLRVRVNGYLQKRRYSLANRRYYRREKGS